MSEVLKNSNEYLDQETKEVFEYCLESTNNILELQKRLIDIYNDYYNKEMKYFEGELESFTRKDIDEAANCLGEIGYIQYQQLVANYESIPKFKYIKELSNPEVKKHINSTVKRYLDEFSINANKQRKVIEDLTYQPNMAELTKEEHIEVEKRVFMKVYRKLMLL